MATLTEIAVKRLERSVNTLAKSYELVPVDKQEWQPEESGRSARSLIRECVLTQGYYGEIIKTGSAPEMDWASEFERVQQIAPEALVAELRSTGEVLAAVVGSMTEEQLARTFFFPYGQLEMSFAEFAFIPAWHNDYHCGQINYIQTLYGDREDHFEFP